MRYLRFMDIQTKREILQAAKTEIMRHRWDTFVDDPPSIAQGGGGVIVSGCPDLTCPGRRVPAQRDC